MGVPRSATQGEDPLKEIEAFRRKDKRCLWGCEETKRGVGDVTKTVKRRSCVEALKRQESSVGVVNRIAGKTRALWRLNVQQEVL